MAILNKPDMNYGVWAEGGNIEIPSSEKVEQGWIIEKPLNETMNWLQNRQDRMLQYINQRGIPEWDVRTEYPTGSYVTRVGLLYQALSNNTDADPTLSPEIWEVAFVSKSDFIDYSERVDNIENTEGYLGLYVSKSFPVMTGVAKGIAYKESTGVSGLSFDTLAPKIVNNGITIAEFSGGNNPKDVVTHEQLALAIQNYKVGDIYITTASGDPSERLGYGTWQRFGEGRTLVGFTTSVSNAIPEWAKVIGREFGEYDHKLTVNEMPSHTHGQRNDSDAGINIPQVRLASGIVTGSRTSTDGGTLSNKAQVLTDSTGSNSSHNNVQPSIVVYFWKRIS